MKFNLRNIQNFFLYVYFFSINFQEVKILNLESLSIPKFSALIYFFSILPNINYFFKFNKNNKSLIAILLFYIILFLSNILNVSINSYAIIDLSMMINIIMFWAIINHFTISKSVAEKSILSFSIGAILLTLFYLLNIGVVISEDNRISLFGDNENFIGIKMSVSIVLILFILLQNNLKLNKFRFLLLLPIPIMIKLLIETGSRVSLLSFLLMVILGVYHIKFKYQIFKIGLFVLIFCSLFIAFQFVLDNQVLLLRLYSSFEKNDIGGREVIYIEIWEIVKHYPILGIGQTGYNKLFGIASPHNVLLEIFSYTGIVGLLVYLYFLYSIFLISKRALVKFNNIIPLLLMIPIAGLLLSGQLLSLKLGWIIFSYIVFHNQHLYINQPKMETNHNA